MPDIFALAGSLGFGDPGGVSTCQSNGRGKISSENFFGDELFRWWLWLLRGFATIGVRHSRWISHQKL